MIPLLDNHGHSLLANFRETKEDAFIAAFSESRYADQMTADIESSVVFLELKKRLLALSNTDSLAHYLAVRNAETVAISDIGAINCSSVSGHSIHGSAASRTRADSHSMGDSHGSAASRTRADSHSMGDNHGSAASRNRADGHSSGDNHGSAISHSRGGRPPNAARDLVKELFLKAGFERIILDDGYAQDKAMSNADFESTTGVKISRVVRIEPVLERLISECPEAADVEKILEKTLLPARDKSIVGLKTIVCYRGGLNLYEIDREDAIANFNDCRRSVLATGRIKKCSYYHYLLLKIFDLALKRDIPVQVHCGMGDDDADLSLSNPELLQRILRKPRFSKLKLVLLHCYPFQKQAAILSSLYPGVHFDLSLACFLLADQAELYREALASASYTKILAGTDGHSQPETYYQGAVALRQGLSSALQLFEQRQSINREEAAAIEAAILNGNARRLYKLG